MTAGPEGRPRGSLAQPRLFVAAAFGVAGTLVSCLWFLPSVLRNRDPTALVLYVVLPGLAAAASAAMLGTPLLDPARGPGFAALRGGAIASVALLLYAPLFATLFALTTPGRATIAGLTLMVLMFSALAVWWVVALIGGLLGLMLHRVATRRRPSPTSLPRSRPGP